MGNTSFYLDVLKDMIILTDAKEQWKWHQDRPLKS
jgi:hypothetical protein